MKEQGYQYTTDLLVIGCGFSGMWAAMRARDFLGDVLVVDKGPRDWGGLGGLSGGDMIVKQPDMKLDDLLDDLVYYYDGLADQKLLGQILTQSYDRFMDFENLGHKFVRNDKGELCFIPQRALDYMRYYYYHPYGMGGIEKARLLKQECEKRGVRRLGRTVITDVITDGERVTGAVGFHSQSHQYGRLEALLPSEHASQRRRQHRLERGLRHAEFRILEGVERACRFRVGRANGPSSQGSPVPERQGRGFHEEILPKIRSQGRSP